MGLLLFEIRVADDVFYAGSARALANNALGLHLEDGGCGGFVNEFVLIGYRQHGWIVFVLFNLDKFIPWEG